MYTLETLITLLLIALVIGLIGGAIIAQRIAPSKQSQQAMQKHVEELQQRQAEYQNEVTEHFSETGQLLNQLTNSYRDVHKHLADGAQMLANQKFAMPIEKLADDTEQTAIEEPEIEPPPIEEQATEPSTNHPPESNPDEKDIANEQSGLDNTYQNSPTKSP